MRDLYFPNYIIDDAISLLRQFRTTGVLHGPPDLQTIIVYGLYRVAHPASDRYIMPPSFFPAEERLSIFSQQPYLMLRVGQFLSTSVSQYMPSFKRCSSFERKEREKIWADAVLEHFPFFTEDTTVRDLLCSMETIDSVINQNSPFKHAMLDAKPAFLGRELKRLFIRLMVQPVIPSVIITSVLITLFD